MTAAATSIERATVTSSGTSVSGSIIYTHYTLRVSEALKGAATTDVALPGGAAGGVRQSFPGVPQLQSGTEYLLFLWKSPTTGITQIVGFSQGIFTVATQPDGSQTASRPPIAETILDANGRQFRDRGLSISLSDIRARAQALGSRGASR